MKVCFKPHVTLFWWCVLDEARTCLEKKSNRVSESYKPRGCQGKIGFKLMFRVGINDI